MKGLFRIYEKLTIISVWTFITTVYKCLLEIVEFCDCDVSCAFGECERILNDSLRLITCYFSASVGISSPSQCWTINDRLAVLALLAGTAGRYSDPALRIYTNWAFLSNNYISTCINLSDSVLVLGSGCPFAKLMKSA